MEKQVDLRGLHMNEAVANKTKSVLSEMKRGKVSFILDSGECASYVSLTAYNLGWDIKLDYRNNCYTLKLCKELEEEICA